MRVSRTLGGETPPLRSTAMCVGRLMRFCLATGNVGQRPFDMAYKVMYFLKDMKEGAAPPAGLTTTGLDSCTPKTVDIGGGGS